MREFKLTIGGQTKRSTTGQRDVVLDWDALPPEAQDFLIRYGMKQYLSDATAGAANEADATAAVNARVDKLKSGDLTRTRGEGKSVDSVEQRALKNAKAAIRAAAKAKSLTVSKEQVDALAAKKVKEDDKWTKQAKVELANEAKMAEDVSLDDLADLI